ncbi:hypothetical protein D934_00355 [Xylella fastidiosa subsp. sandyi Ann-1]|uniref:Uncharacterized protein n=1 Tax=Xylella fastidiosa subsp. sandyi Ann-1 TaxID=155920 RepID=A0A060HDD6_XYLFS|nr:hypothetical protein D934_00355 [Xylella fastidiosa subsp. sandyi Ann-1]
MACKTVKQEMCCWDCGLVVFVVFTDMDMVRLELRCISNHQSIQPERDLSYCDDTHRMLHEYT